MTRIDIIAAVPELLGSLTSHSILGRAQAKGLAQIVVHNLRDYATGKYKAIDDAPYGGGAGMVMMVEPIDRCIEHLRSERTYREVIYMSPDGIPLDQSLCNRLALEGNLIILCGHYKGVDERVREHLCTMEISVGRLRAQRRRIGSRRLDGCRGQALAGGPGRREQCIDRFLSGWIGRPPRLYQARQLQRLDRSRNSTIRPRGQNQPMEARTSLGANPAQKT